MTYSLPRRLQDASPLPPAAFDQILARFPAHGATDGLRNALGGLAATYRAIVEDHKRISSDKMATPGASLVRSARSAKIKLDASMNKLRSERAQSIDAHRDLRAKIHAPFKAHESSFAATLLAREIRDHFRALPLPQRLEAIQIAVEHDDQQTLTAIASAPSFLLQGVPQQVWDFAREKVIAANAPDESAALAALTEAEFLVEQVESNVLQSVANLIDFQTAGDLERGAEPI